jgi:hypothetical protein
LTIHMWVGGAGLGAKDCMSRYKALLERRKELEQRIASQKGACVRACVCVCV